MGLSQERILCPSLHGGSHDQACGVGDGGGVPGGVLPGVVRGPSTGRAVAAAARSPRRSAPHGRVMQQDQIERAVWTVTFLLVAAGWFVGTIFG